MILADTSVWIDHLRHGSAEMEALLLQGQIVIHPLSLPSYRLVPFATEDKGLKSSMPYSPSR